MANGAGFHGRTGEPCTGLEANNSKAELSSSKRRQQERGIRKCRFYAGNNRNSHSLSVLAGKQSKISVFTQEVLKKRNIDPHAGREAKKIMIPTQHGDRNFVVCNTPSARSRFCFSTKSEGHVLRSKKIGFKRWTC